MKNNHSYHELQATLRAWNVNLDVLHAAFQIAMLDRSVTKHVRKRAHKRIHKNQPVYLEERMKRVVALINHLDSVRQTDLEKICSIAHSTMTQTIVPKLQAADPKRVELITYRGEQAGQRANWLQRPNCGVLADARRKEIRELISLILTYQHYYWEAQQAAGYPVPPAYASGATRRKTVPHRPKQERQEQISMDCSATEIRAELPDQSTVVLEVAEESCPDLSGHGLVSDAQDLVAVSTQLHEAEATIHNNLLQSESCSTDAGNEDQQDEASSPPLCREQLSPEERVTSVGRYHPRLHWAPPVGSMIPRSSTSSELPAPNQPASSNTVRVLDEQSSTAVILAPLPETRQLNPISVVSAPTTWRMISRRTQLYSRQFWTQLGIGLVVSMVLATIWLIEGDVPTSSLPTITTAPTSIAEQIIDPSHDAPPTALTSADTKQEVCRNAIVAIDGLRLRSHPSTTGTEITKLPRGATIEVQCDTAPIHDDGIIWIHIRFRGQTGWVAERKDDVRYLEYGTGGSETH